MLFVVMFFDAPMLSRELLEKPPRDNFWYVSLVFCRGFSEYISLAFRTFWYIVELVGCLTLNLLKTSYLNIVICLRQ